MTKRRKGRQAVTRAVLLAAASGLVLAACSSGGPAGSKATTGSVVARPGLIRRVVTTTMAKNNRANTELSSKLLASFEAGTAYRLDAATYKADQIAERESGAKVPYSPFTLKPEVSSLEKTATFPADFVVGGKTVSTSGKAPKGPVCGSLLIFAKERAGEDWKIVLEPSTNGKSLPKLATRNGYGAKVSAGARQAAERLPAKVAAALMQEETSGRLGPFTKSDFTGNCWQLPNPRSDLLAGEAAGYTARDLFSVLRPADTLSFGLAGGRTLVVFTIKFQDQLDAASSSLPVRWSHASVRQNPGGTWTYFLGAGEYANVKERGDLQVAAVLSPDLKSYSVVGAYYGVTSVTGKKSKAVKNTAPGGTLAAFWR